MDYFFFLLRGISTIIKRNPRGLLLEDILSLHPRFCISRNITAYHDLFSPFTGICEHENFYYARYYRARIYQTVGTFNSGPIPTFLELFDEREFNSRVNYRSGLNPFALWRN